MIFINSTSNNIGSRLIRWGRESESSHFAIGFGDYKDPCTLIVHSQLNRGVHPVWLKDFEKNNRIISILKIDIEADQMLEAYNALVKEIGGADYDNDAIGFWVLVSLMQKVANIAMPPKNRFGKKDDFYCVEVLWGIRGILRKLGFDIPNDRKFFESMDPQDAYEWLKQSDFVYEVPVE